MASCLSSVDYREKIHYVVCAILATIARALGNKGKSCVYVRVQVHFTEDLNFLLSSKTRSTRTKDGESPQIDSLHDRVRRSTSCRRTSHRDRRTDSRTHISGDTPPRGGAAVETPWIGERSPARGRKKPPSVDARTVCVDRSRSDRAGARATPREHDASSTT